MRFALGSKISIHYDKCNAEKFTHREVTEQNAFLSIEQILLKTFLNGLTSLLWLSLALALFLFFLIKQDSCCPFNCSFFSLHCILSHALRSLIPSFAGHSL